MTVTFTTLADFDRKGVSYRVRCYRFCLARGSEAREKERQI